MSKYYIGLLSGTSVDGIDVAIVDFGDNKINLISNHEQPFSDLLKSNIQSVIKSQSITLTEFSELDSLLAFEFSQAINALINKSDIDKNDVIAIGSHGQTVYHQPEGNHPNTIQIGSAHKIAAMTNINVVCNFRNLDMALEGQGAPLAPLIHHELFKSNHKNTAVINLGGIANISFIGKDYKRIIGYDIGPANCLIDEWIQIHKQQPYDKNGSWARQGDLNEILLKQMLSDEYFSKSAPKSTGREYFNHHWYEKFIEQFQKTSVVDIQTTLTHLVAASIQQEIADKSIDTIILMGGGSNNRFIKELIESYCGIETKISNEFGYDANWIEAILFAYLAYKRTNNQKLDLSSVTGSSRSMLIGDIVSIK